MSKPTETTTPSVEIVPNTETVETEKRPNIAVRGWRKVRQNPKAAIAVVGGAALLTLAAAAGYKAADSSDPSEEEFDETPELEIDEPDTTVA